MAINQLISRTTNTLVPIALLRISIFIVYSHFFLFHEFTVAQVASSEFSNSYFYVRTPNELFSALKSAESGQTVYIADGAVLDLSGYENIRIPEGVTLAGGRADGLALGALIYSNKLRTYPLFITSGENVRITGLRIRGPDTSRRTNQMKNLIKRNRFYSVANSRGIQVTHSGVEIDNCELWGWSHAAIALLSGAENANIHDNYIHHNQRHGLGYGVVLDQATASINDNFFDWNRHAISATGRPGTSYFARGNIVGENSSSHAFDMHGGRDRKDGTNIAGSQIVIVNNIFYLKASPAVKIRGRPMRRSIIASNCFSNLNVGSAIIQLYSNENLIKHSNQIGNCSSF